MVSTVGIKMKDITIYITYLFIILLFLLGTRNSKERFWKQTGFSKSNLHQFAVTFKLHLFYMLASSQPHLSYISEMVQPYLA